MQELNHNIYPYPSDASMKEATTQPPEADGSGLPDGCIDITERLVIRELTLEYSDTLYEILHNCADGVFSEVLSVPYPEFREWLKAYIAGQYGFYGYGMWGIFLKESSAMIGVVSVVNGSASQIGELSYAILSEYRRKGYALEACRAALEYARECGFTGFEAQIDTQNTASLALARKLGINIITDVRRDL